MLGPSLLLTPSHLSFPAKRRDAGSHDEEGRSVDQDRNGQRLEAVRLKSLEFIELKRSRQTSRLHPARVERSALVGEPDEAAFDRASRDSESTCRLALPDAVDHEMEEERVDVRLLLPVVGAEGLPGEARLAGPAAKALDGVRPTLRAVAAEANAEIGAWIFMAAARGAGAAGRGEHDRPSSRSVGTGREDHESCRVEGIAVFTSPGPGRPAGRPDADRRRPVRQHGRRAFSYGI
jgi:hypothetical protein